MGCVDHGVEFCVVSTCLLTLAYSLHISQLTVPVMLVVILRVAFHSRVMLGCGRESPAAVQPAS